MNIKNSNFGIICAFFGFGLYAISDTCIKYAGADITPVATAFWAQAAGLIALLCCAFVCKLSLKTLFLKLQLIRAVLLAVCYLTFIYAIQFISLAEGYAIFFSAPFLVALLSVFILGEKIGVFRIAAVMVGFLGVLIVLRPGVIPMGLPSIAMLISAFTFSLSNVLTRKIGETEPTLAFALYPTAFIAITFGLYMLFMEPLSVPSNFNLSLLATAGVVETVACVLVARAFVLAHPVTVMKFDYFNIVWALIIGYYIFGDLVDNWMLVGASVTIASGVFLGYREYLHSLNEQGATPAST